MVFVEQKEVSRAAKATKMINGEREEHNARRSDSFRKCRTWDARTALSFKLLQNAVKMGLCQWVLKGRPGLGAWRAFGDGDINGKEGSRNWSVLGDC